jgi:hypothetical protein
MVVALSGSGRYPPHAAAALRHNTDVLPTLAGASMHAETARSDTHEFRG